MVEDDPVPPFAIGKIEVPIVFAWDKLIEPNPIVVPERRNT